MRIDVRYFAAAREAVGQAEESLDVASGATAGSLLDLALERHPALAPLRPSLRLALDGRFVGETEVVVEGSVLALLPPVSGG